MTSDKPVANYLIDALLACGVRTLVCSPGSRNAPLVLAAVARPDLEVLTLGDERSAAFHALGRSLVGKVPVALCCTSGSALANYAPAIIEAYYSKVPLVVLTADRPADRIGKGEGQTCEQRDFFKPHIGFSAQVDEQTSDAQLTKVFQKAARVLLQRHEPVHLNVAFEEPLYGTTEQSPVLEGFTVPEIRPRNRHAALRKWLKNNSLEGVSWAVVAGQFTESQSRAMRAWLEKNRPGFTLFADPTSGLLDLPSVAPMEALLELKPEVVVSLGGQWVDKRPKFHLRGLKLKAHLHLDPYQHWDVLDAGVIKSFGEATAGLALLRPFWAGADFGVPKNLAIGHELLPWSDARVFAEVMASLSAEDVLHLGNSTAVRYFGFFPANVALYGNRGVAGIDGSLSTAVGAASADPNRRHVAVLGDQSFLYDSNGLYVNALPVNLTVVVLNNAIGAIFDWLPGVAQAGEAAQAVFANRQHVDLAQLSRAFGAAYTKVESAEELRRAMRANRGALHVIEADTKHAPNELAYRKLKR